jgi:hypothetical protein
MRKTMTAAVAALTLGGAVATGAAPAAAQGHHGRGHYSHGGHWGGHHGSWRGGHYYRGYDAGPAIFAGVAGLALGAALADSRPAYGYGYNYGYGYGPGPAYCETGHWSWDYWGRRVWVRETYPC